MAPGRSRRRGKKPPRRRASRAAPGRAECRHSESGNSCTSGRWHEARCPGLSAGEQHGTQAMLLNVICFWFLHLTKTTYLPDGFSANCFFYWMLHADWSQKPSSAPHSSPNDLSLRELGWSSVAVSCLYAVSRNCYAFLETAMALFLVLCFPAGFLANSAESPLVSSQMRIRSNVQRRKQLAINLSCKYAVFVKL